MQSHPRAALHRGCTVAAPLERKERSGWRCGTTWSWEARIRRERGRGGRRSGGRGVEQERRKGERDRGYTVENSLPCPSSTNDRHLPFPPSPLARIPLHLAFALSLSLFFSLSHSLPAGLAPHRSTTPLPLSTPLHTKQHTSRMTRITSQRRERATCCPLLPPLTSSCRHPPPPLSVPVRYLSRFTSADPTPPQATPRSPRRPAVGTHERDRIHTICGALYIYSAIAASTRQD